MPSDEAYFDELQPILESLLSSLVNDVVDSRPADLELFLLERLHARRQRAASSSMSALHTFQKAQEQRKRGEWTAVSWVDSVGVASAVAHALLHNHAGSEESKVNALKKLGDHSLPELVGVLRDGGLVENVGTSQRYSCPHCVSWPAPRR
jgi:hypothetical protein